MDLLETVRRIKKERKMTVAEMSKMSGISYRTIDNWLHYGNQPTLDNFEKVLAAMGYELRIEKVTDGDYDNT